MNFQECLDLEPQKYWAPPKTSTIISQIIASPEKFPQYAFTPKMDGEWTKLMWDGEHTYMLARSRNVKGEFTDRWEKFPHIIAEFKDLPINTILLGEIAYSDITKTSKDVGSVMRSLVPRALKIQETSPLHYFIFDCLMWNGVDLSTKSYQERFWSNHDLFDYMFNKEIFGQYTHILIPRPVMELNSYLEGYFAIGGEGVVLIDVNSKYTFGGRPAKASVKIKKQLDEFEAKVISTLEPNRDYEGTELENWQYWVERHTPDLKNPALYTEKQSDGRHRVKSINFGYSPVTKPYFYGWKNGLVCEYEGRTFSVTSGLTDSDRTWLATEEAQESIKGGKLYAVCGAMELTPDSVRHPYLSRMRDDM